MVYECTCLHYFISFMILIWLSQASVQIIFFSDANQISSHQIPILSFCTSLGEVPTSSSSVTKSCEGKRDLVKNVCSDWEKLAEQCFSLLKCICILVGEHYTFVQEIRIIEYKEWNGHWISWNTSIILKQKKMTFNLCLIYILRCMNIKKFLFSVL